MRYEPQHASRASGFSLVELMVALVLGLILMGGVISVYTTSKSTYSLNNALGQVQEAGRFAFSYLEPPIRMAGFYGCAHDVTPLSVLNPTTGQETYDSQNAIVGYEYTGTGIGANYTISSGTPTAATSGSSWSANSGNLPSDIANAVGIGASSYQAIQGSDLLVLHEALAGGVNLTNPYQDTVNGDSLKILPADAGKISIGEIVVVTDCSQSRMMQITNISSGSGLTTVDHSGNGTYLPGDSASTKFGTKFGSGSQILVYQTYIFYVGIGKDGGPSLFEIGLGGTGSLNGAQEVVSGVETMQILYGIDTDGDQIPNAFETADQVTNWSQVVSMRIALITQSDNNSTDTAPPSAASYVLLGDSATDTTNGLKVKVPLDRRLRRVFTETVSIRNRAP